MTEPSLKGANAVIAAKQLNPTIFDQIWLVDNAPPDPLKAAQDQLALRSETPRKRIPTKSILIREGYPPEEPEWSPDEYTATVAVKKFYEMGDADLTQAE